MWTYISQNQIYYLLKKENYAMKFLVGMKPKL